MYSKRSLLIYRVLFAIAMLFSAHLSGRAQDQSITIVYEAPHANGIDSVAFSPNGKQVMSSGRDRALKLWDVASGHLVRTLQQHKDGAYVIVFSPDGSRVISESEDDTLKLWDTVTGEVIRTYQDQSGVGRVSFSPNGEYFLSQDLITPGGEGIRRWSRRAIRDFAAFNKPYDKTDVVNLWSSATGTRVQTFSAQAHVHAVWFSADGKELTFVVRDFGRDEPTEFQTWDVPSGRLIRAIRAGNGCNADEGAFSPDGTVYVARSIDSEQAKVLDAKVLHRPGSYTFVLCETASGRAVRTFVGDYLPIQVAFSPDGKRIVAGGYNNDVTIWNTASAKIVLTLKGHTDEVHAVSFSPDGNTIVSGSHDKTLKLWDASNGKMIKSLGASAETVASVAFSPDGTRALTGSFDGMLRLWDATNGRLIHTMVGDPNSVNAVTFSPDGRYLISGGDDHTVKLWDAVTGALIRTFQGHSDEVKAVAFSPDGSRVLSAGGSWPNARDTSIKLWDARSGQLLRTLDGHTEFVSSLAFSRDGRRILSGSFDQTANLWDLGTGKIIRSFKNSNDDSSGVTSVAFSADGRQVLSASEDGTVRLWDVGTRKLLRSFEHGHTVTSIAVSQDFTRLASASGDTLELSSEGTAGTGDRTIKIWDLSNGRLLRTLKGHFGGVKATAFSPDGARILSGSQDTTAALWNARTGELLASFVAADKDKWLTITPQGFFNSTRQGGDLLAVVKSSTVITIEQTRQSLFDPDLVREAIAGDPAGEVREAAKVINLAKILDSGPAPIVAITSHPSISQADSDLVTVQALVTDQGKGIGRIEWRVNGITAAVNSTFSGTHTATQSLALDGGENTIEVIAYNESNLLASVPARITINFSGVPNQTKPKLYVLAIGINAYSGSQQFPKLTFAVNDATAFADDIKRAGTSMYEDVSVKQILDESATKQKLESVIEALAAEVQPRDTFIFFAAAHGVAVDGHFYLIPQDFEDGPEDLAHRAIAQDELQNWLARIKAKKAILLLDTCESGALVNGHLRSREDPALAAVGRLHEATGRPVLTAAAVDKVALAAYHGHGVFTWAVLDALGKGDINGNGTIELSELVTYVESAVPKISAELDGAGRAAVALSGSIESAQPNSYRQEARFGGTGEDFAIVQRLR